MLEAKDSFAIENIITTYDDLYKNDLFEEFLLNPSTKEVSNYASALRKGYNLILEKKVFTNNIILNVQAEIENNNAGFSKQPGTDLRNEATGEIIYTTSNLK